MFFNLDQPSVNFDRLAFSYKSCSVKQRINHSILSLIHVDFKVNLILKNYVHLFATIIGKVR